MKTKKSWVLAAILALAAVYFYQDPGWNGNSRLDGVRAVVEEGKFNIDAYQAQPEWATEDKVSLNGHYYTDKAPGSSILAIPAYFVLFRLAGILSLTLGSSLIKHFLTALIIGGSFIINGLVMYQIALVISKDSWKAFGVSAAVSFGTMLWPYSAVYFGHVPAGMFLCLAFYQLFKMHRLPETAGPDGYFWSGVALGLAFITDYTTALIIAGLIAYAVLNLHAQILRNVVRAGLLGALGTLIPLSLLFAWNFLAFGNPFTLGYGYYGASQTESLGRISGVLALRPDLAALYHLTFDPQFGLFWQSPILILAFVGYGAAFQRRFCRAEALVSFFSIASTLLLNASIQLWWGGHAFGARYLIAALPFFVIPLALIPDLLNWPAIALGVVSGAQMLIPLMGLVQMPIDWIASRKQFWVELKPFHGFSILWGYGLPLIVKSISRGTPSWTLGYAIRILPYRLYLSLPIFLAAEAYLIAIFYKITKTGPLQPIQDA